MATKKINSDGTITWTFSSIQELIDYQQQIAQNPYRLDDDLEAKDQRDSWRD